MRAFLDALVILMVFKGLEYFFFTNWVKNYVAQNIIEAKPEKLKWCGLLMIIIGLTFYFSFVRHIH